MINDPTFQNAGHLLVYFRNDTSKTRMTNGKWNGIPLKSNPPVYLPLDSPPPEWPEGKGGYTYYPGEAIASGTWIPDAYSKDGMVAGAGIIARIDDMSSQAVREGKAYFFSVDAPIMWVADQASVRLAWTIEGVSGGSKLKALFGLYGTDEAPNAWRYLEASFSSPNYQIVFSLINPDYPEPVALKATYIPCRRAMNLDATSRLMFTITGTLANRSFSDQDSLPAQDVLSADDGTASQRQELLAASSDYRTIDWPA